MKYDFDQVLSRTELSTSKWEQEIARLNRPDLLAFGTADMDFRSAEPIVEALTATARRGHFGYPFKPQSYYEAIIGFCARRFGWQIQQEWISGATGVYAAWNAVVERLSEPGDEIIFQTPAHHIFNESILAMGRVPVENPLIVRDGKYELDLEGLEKVITARSKLMLLCNPHNPTGRVWTFEELSALQALCLRHGIVMVTDEIYAGLVHREHTFTPAASISSAASNNTITLTSASKTYNTTGLKHALVIIENPELRQAYFQGQQRSNMYYGGSLFGHVATEFALRDCDDWNEQLVEYIEGNVAYASQALARLFPKATVYQPESTYFLWVDMSAYAESSTALLQCIEQRLGVTITSGHMLGTGGDRHIRINLGCPRVQLEQAVMRIEQTMLA